MSSGGGRGPGCCVCLGWLGPRNPQELGRSTVVLHMNSLISTEDIASPTEGALIWWISMMASSIPPLAQHATALSGAVGTKDPSPVTMDNSQGW